MYHDQVRTLSQKIHEWSFKNFGVQAPMVPLLGVGEEIGEMIHAMLKRAQGIRGHAEEHWDAMRDALGDMAIYLLDYIGARDLADPGMNPLEISAEDLTQRFWCSDWTLYPFYDLFDIYSELLRMEELMARGKPAHEGRLLQQSKLPTLWRLMCRFWNTIQAEKGIFTCFEEYVEMLWTTQVSKRDWTKNPEHGV